ncbi:MAG TPA: sulfite exporter TauE/SafE family protein [Jiangellales bacterium]|nr:sulfite exporter TauE/SafE family protein [Jiangellales bacterium]
MTDPWLLAALGLALGTVMGLLGGGGAVLAIPLLVHVVGVGFGEAASTSLLVVLVGAAAGLAAYRGTGRVQVRTGLRFGLLGVAGAAAGALLAAQLPDPPLRGAFAVLLVVAGVAMLRDGPPVSHGVTAPVGGWRLLWMASALGLVTGLLGVGGGFLVVPVLVVAVGLPVHVATATGLLVLAVTSVAALLVRTGVGLAVDPAVAGLLVLGTASGAVAGARLSHRVPAAALRRGFGVLLLAVAAYTAVDAMTGLP